MMNVKYRSALMLALLVVIAAACGSRRKKSSPSAGTPATPVRID